MVKDAITVITQVVGCDESVEAFQRVDNVSVPVDLVVGGSRSTKENILVTLMNLVKSDETK